MQKNPNTEHQKPSFRWGGCWCYGARIIAARLHACRKFSQEQSIAKALRTQLCSWLLGPEEERRIMNLIQGKEAEAKRHAQSSELTWLRRDFDVRKKSVPEVPEDLTRIIGLDIGQSTHPAIVLSGPLVESLEWICRQGRKTKQRIQYLAREIKAFEEQGTAAHAQNLEREKRINELQERLKNYTYADGENRLREVRLVERLKDELSQVEDQRARWEALRRDMVTARVREAIFHYRRVANASVTLEAYFENSGLLNFDLDAYMDEVREAPPELRKYYDEVRGDLLKHSRNRIFADRLALDAEERTQTADATRQTIPSELEAVIAEYNSRLHDVNFAQAEFDDRNKLKQENKFRREEVEAAGERVPDDTEFDLNCLREDMRKTRNLRKAEQNLSDVRARLRQHVATSDVDSVVPMHDTPIKGVMHTALVRAAKTSTKIDNWLKETDAESFGPGPRASSVEGADDDLGSLEPEDSFSIVEQNPFLIARKRGWQNIKATEGVAPVEIDMSESDRTSDRSGWTRRRRRSSTGSSEYTNGSIKRQKPLRVDVAT